MDSSDIDQFEETKHLLKLNWNSLKIELKNLSFKSIFGNNSIEIMLFDLMEFKLYFFRNNQKEIMESFKVGFCDCDQL